MALAEKIARSSAFGHAAPAEQHPLAQVFHQHRAILLGENRQDFPHDLALAERPWRMQIGLNDRVERLPEELAHVNLLQHRVPDEWCLTGCPDVNVKLPAGVDFAILNTRITGDGRPVVALPDDRIPQRSKRAREDPLAMDSVN